MNSFKVRLTFYIVALVLIVGLAYWRLYQYAKEKDQAISSTALPPQDEERLLVDNAHHTITVVDGRIKNKAPVITRSYLNPRGEVSIDESKSGSIAINERTWGTELAPFGGVSFGSDVELRGAVGLNLSYYRNLDAGIGVLFASKLQETRCVAKVSYNFYSNLELGLGVDNHKNVQLLATVRF